MSGEDLAQLLALQDLDTGITQLEHRRVALYERTGLAAVEAELASLSAEQTAAEREREALLVTQKDLEAQIAVVNERRTGIEQRMYAARGSSTRDLQAMDDEVRHLTERRSALEESELVAMVDQEPIDAALTALAARRAPVDERAVALRAQVAEQHEEIERQLAEAVTARAAAAAKVSSALAERYENLRARFKGIGVARLIGHRCDGCHLEMSSAEAERVRAQSPDSVVTCDQCGRILVPV
jgi:predicted  nucleic acid-binding Zn-ribbon protein